MPIVTTERESPGWWLNRLLKKLAEQAPHFEELDCYYRGENGVPFHADKAVRASYQRLMRMARTNFAELVVEAVRERMNPIGFRTAGSDDPLGDKEAWRIWQANSLDADHALLDRVALSQGLAFLIVGGPDEDIGAPLITGEDPREVVVETDPRRRRKVLAALKCYRDDVNDVHRAYLYLPGVVHRAFRPGAPDGAQQNAEGWEWENGGEQLPAGLEGVVPVVPVVPRADLSGCPRGEFEPHLSILDRINYSLLNRLEIATLQAYRQRAVKGVPVADAEGNEINYDDIFAADPGAFWLLPSTAEIWESQQVDLGPLRAAIRDDVQDLAAATRTPLFYLTPDSANGSAEGASLAREGLVFKTDDRVKQTGEALEAAMVLAFRMIGDTERASRPDMEVLWASTERFSLTARADAAAKAMAGGMSWRAVMTEIWQLSPQQIDQMQGELVADQLRTQSAAALGDLVTGGTGATGPEGQPPAG